MPFFIQVILGLGSPAAWHTNDATPPEMPVWSSGDLTKLGMPGGEPERRGTGRRGGSDEKREGSKSGTGRRERRQSRMEGGRGKGHVNASHVGRLNLVICGYRFLHTKGNNEKTTLALLLCTPAAQPREKQPVFVCLPVTV